MRNNAVVLIHGIGEQQPMGTIRPFASAILGRKGVGGDYWSKPDKMSELFELRRLQAKSRQKIHFYEYYWAYNLEGTSISDVLTWGWVIISRRWRNVPRSAKTIWLVSRILCVAVLISFIAGVSIGLADLTEFVKSSWIWFVVSGVGLFFQFILIRYLGDAARYLSPRPRNIRLRQKIRSEGIRLLRKLHESGEYDRIILVGHSLGSVIAYDIVTHLWNDYNDQLPGLSEPGIRKSVRDKIKAKHPPQPKIGEEILKVGRRVEKGEVDAAEFQKAQFAAAKEYRSFKNPWLVTDLITLGSPLAHGLLWFASSKEDFEFRKKQRELTTCPPQQDRKGYAYCRRVVDLGEGKKFSPLVLHHASVFAVTRWTNLYFPARLGIFGDFVGGPLAEEFGLGIRDIPVRTTKWKGIANMTIFSHTQYWRLQDDLTANQADTNSEMPVSLFALRKAIQ